MPKKPGRRISAAKLKKEASGAVKGGKSAALSAPPPSSRKCTGNSGLSSSSPNKKPSYTVPENEWVEVWKELRQDRESFGQKWTGGAFTEPRRAADVFGSVLYSVRLDKSPSTGFWPMKRSECLGSRKGDIPPEWLDRLPRKAEIETAKLLFEENWLKEMLFERRLKRVCLGAMEEAGHRVQEAFSRFDRDGSGEIDAAEFSQMLRALPIEGNREFRAREVQWLTNLLVSAGEKKQQSKKKLKVKKLLVCFEDFRRFVERPNRVGVSSSVEFHAVFSEDLPRSLKRLYDPRDAAPAFHPMYSFKKLAERDTLKFDPSVRRWLNYLWRNVDTDKSGRIELDEYVVMHKNISTLLLDLPGTCELAQQQRGKVGGAQIIQDDMHRDLALEDWESDHQNFGFLDYNRFVSCWFQVADQFTSGISAGEYASFLKRMALKMYPREYPDDRLAEEREAARLATTAAAEAAAAEEAALAAIIIEAAADETVAQQAEAERQQAEAEAAKEAAEAEAAMAAAQKLKKTILVVVAIQRRARGRRGRRATRAFRAQRDYKQRAKEYRQKEEAERRRLTMEERKPVDLEELAELYHHLEDPPLSTTDAMPVIAIHRLPPPPPPVKEQEKEKELVVVVEEAVVVVAEEEEEPIEEEEEEEAPPPPSAPAPTEAELRAVELEEERLRLELREAIASMRVRRASRIIAQLCVQKSVLPRRERATELKRLELLKVLINRKGPYASRFVGGGYSDDSDEDEEQEEEKHATSEVHLTMLMSMPCVFCQAQVVCTCQTDRGARAIQATLRSQCTAPSSVSKRRLGCDEAAVEEALNARAHQLCSMRRYHNKKRRSIIPAPSNIMPFNHIPRQKKQSSRRQPKVAAVKAERRSAMIQTRFSLSSASSLPQLATTTQTDEDALTIRSTLSAFPKKSTYQRRPSIVRPTTSPPERLLRFEGDLDISASLPWQCGPEIVWQYVDRKQNHHQHSTRALSPEVGSTTAGPSSLDDRRTRRGGSLLVGNLTY